MIIADIGRVQPAAPHRVRNDCFLMSDWGPADMFREELGDKAIFAGGKGLSKGTTAPELKL